MPESALARWGMRLSFAARQSSRVAWYAAHGAVLRRMVARINAQSSEPRRPIKRPSRPVVPMRRLFAGVAALLARDLANLERGYYPMPTDEDGGLTQLIATSRAFFRDVPEVERRRRQGLHNEVPAANGAGRPHYYLQNFHFQSGGWLTEESAQLYDMQVEVLFGGAANAMRRQALVPMSEALKGRDQRRIRYADIACGPGTFLREVRRAFPRLPAFAIDLSEAYLREGKRRLGRRPQLQLAVAKGEALPLADDSLDIATCNFLFHELPPNIRRAVAHELGRVLRPGGFLFFVDSLQTGDAPDYDGLLELFPELFHEPYFASYLEDDFRAVFEAAGLTLESSTNAFLSKVVTFRKR
jgi:ubiquinone/menaquinone biosynthesis C-methylase UbiE